MEKYVQRKILFRDTRRLLSNMPYRGRDDRAVWACAVARTTWSLHCQLAPWKSNEALLVFLWSEGVKPSGIYRRMKVQYEDSCFSQGRVFQWVERFQNGRPVSVATETVKHQIEQRIRDYRWVIIIIIINSCHPLGDIGSQQNTAIWSYFQPSS